MRSRHPFVHRVGVSMRYSSRCSKVVRRDPADTVAASASLPTASPGIPVFAVALALLTLAPAHAQNVGIVNGAGGWSYATIAGTMKNASPGDFLLLRTGFTFVEGISLGKDLSCAMSDPLCISVSLAAPRALIAPSTGRAIDSQGHDLTLMRVDVRGGSGVAEAGGVIRVGTPGQDFVDVLADDFRPTVFQSAPDLSTP